MKPVYLSRQFLLLTSFIPIPIRCNYQCIEDSSPEYMYPLTTYAALIKSTYARRITYKI